MSKRDERIGSKIINAYGELIECIDYIDAHKVFVKFENGEIHQTKWETFKNGTHLSPQINRVGEVRTNTQGLDMECIEWYGGKIKVKFKKSGYETFAEWREFNNGKIIDHLSPTIYGVATVGTEIPIYVNKKQIKEYQLWFGMLSRCYSEMYKNTAAYQNVYCSEEWLYFPNFYKWIHSQSNYNNILNERIEIDKDILIPGNKFYSSESCCVVPYYVNRLLVKPYSRKDESCHIGVCRKTDNDNIFIALCNYKGEQKYLGSFKTEMEAFNVYKNFKESYIQEVAKEEYSKNRITERCYNALMNYTVEW